MSVKNHVIAICMLVPIGLFMLCGAIVMAGILRLNILRLRGLMSGTRVTQLPFRDFSSALKSSFSKCDGRAIAGLLYRNPRWGIAWVFVMLLVAVAGSVAIALIFGSVQGFFERP